MSVRGLRRGAVAASRVAGTPTTYTIFGDAADGYCRASSSNLTTADAVNTSANGINIGQQVGIYDEGFIAFDTSGVAGTITAVTLSLYGDLDASTTDFIVEARIHDWGATLTTADWVPGNTLGTKTLVASKSTSGGWSTVAYNVLTSEAAFLSNINQAGFTRLILCSSRQRSGNAPSGAEVIACKSANNSGTSQDPKLVIQALV